MDYDDDDGLYERMQYTQTPKKRKRDEFESEVKNNEREIRNALASFMFGEGAFVKLARQRQGEDAIRLLFMDEFRL